MSSTLNDPSSQAKRAHVSMHQVSERLDVPVETVQKVLETWAALRPPTMAFTHEQLPMHPELTPILQQGLDHLLLGADLTSMALGRMGVFGTDLLTKDGNAVSVRTKEALKR